MVALMYQSALSASRPSTLALTFELPPPPHKQPYDSQPLL